MSTSEQPSGPPRRRSLLGVLYRSSAIRYLVVGGTSFLIDFGLLWLLHDIAGLPLWVATAAAFLLSFAFNYGVQKAFAFTSDASHSRSLLKYSLLVAVNTLAITGIVQLFESLGATWQLGKIVATALSTIWNYFAYRYLVFVDRPLRHPVIDAAALAAPDPVDDQQDGADRRDHADRGEEEKH